MKNTSVSTAEEIICTKCKNNIFQMFYKLKIMYKNNFPVYMNRQVYACTNCNEILELKKEVANDKES